jgi:leucyl/phenylalanyl-tRNA---protein transferase
VPVFLSSPNDKFPDVLLADDDGLIAISQDMDVERLLQAYSKGIFPWFEDDDGFVYWFCTQPRCILLPHQLRISTSMKKLIRKQTFTFKYNTQFKQVILHCSNIKRSADNDTWISSRFIRTYTQLYNDGYGFSGETYLNGVLVGGIYGVRLGNIFFGESMFSLVSNASKFALINTINTLKEQGLAFIDCQQATSHILSMGAHCVSINEFKILLEKHGIV